MSIFFWQETTGPDMTLNYVLLAILVVIAAILGYRVVTKRGKGDE